jgi:threonine synthase
MRRCEPVENLECLFCHKFFPVNPFNTFCPDCHEPLLFPSTLSKKTIHLEKSISLEKFLDFLPLRKIETHLCLSQGDTPLVPLFRLMEKFNLPKTFAKNETLNPTGSFKDRGTVVGVHKAVQSGISRIGTVSTGNMASSTAAFGARAGLQTLVLVKEDTSSEKILSTLIHNPYLIRVRGDYGKLFKRSFDLGQKFDIYFINSVDPFRIEGYKVIGFEIYLGFESQPPEYIIVPVSAGGHIIGLMKAFIELKELDFISHIPVFIGVQAEGCAPIARAFSSQKREVERFKKADTIAHAISNPDPPGGNIVLKLMQNHGGQVITVNDREILTAQKLLAEYEGLFCLPASAATLAGLLKLSKQDLFSMENQIVLVLTGTGLKSLDVLESTSAAVHQTTLDGLDQTLTSLII